MTDSRYTLKKLVDWFYERYYQSVGKRAKKYVILNFLVQPLVFIEDDSVRRLQIFYDD